MPSVNDGLVLLIPALFELQDGVTAGRSAGVKIPETCQSLTSCLMTGSRVNVGTS